MAVVDYNNNPTITDTVRFRLETPDASGCLTMPYRVDKVIVYFVERDFSSGKTNQYDQVTYQTDKINAALAAEAVACANPTDANIAEAKRLRAVAESNANTTAFYFNEATPIKIVGSPSDPVWQTGHLITAISATSPAVITSTAHGLSNGDLVYLYSTDSIPAIDAQYAVTVLGPDTFSVPVDLSGGTAGTTGMWFTDLENSNNSISPVVVGEKTVSATFEFLWSPVGAREGDYFICWTWTPLIAGDPLSSHIKFNLMGNTQVTTSIPSHFTDPKKYPTLLDRYLPEMYKLYIADKDLTPDVLKSLNGAIAMGFETLENLGNQIVDLQDPNTIHEAMLPYLANLFNLKLKTADPTRWRAQIGRAIPQYKAKGTKIGLQRSFELAGVRMTSLKQLWQLVSKYTWQQSFVYDGSSVDFTLDKVLIEPLDTNNFELYVRFWNDANPDAYNDSYTQLTSDYVSFSTVDGVTTMTWVGDTLSVDPVVLTANDIVRVLYQYNTIPNPTEQTYEDYLRTLPLMDQRDETTQSHPPKNWNVRVIEEDDVLFNSLIPTRHPYHDFLVYGKIRTEFPYSENIYNMDEYNGSIRNSKVPCDIDKHFVDPCNACMSSSYNIELEVEGLSDDRIKECQEVLKENTPFHAVLHTLNFVGGFQEFVASPIEEIEAYVGVQYEESCIAGDAQMYFNRAMKYSNLNNLPTSQTILRDELASSTEVISSVTATAYNSSVVLFCPTETLTGIGVRNDSTTILEVLDGPYAGSYPVIKAEGNSVEFDPAPVEPIDNCQNIFQISGDLSTCALPFRIINPMIDLTYNASLCNVERDHLVVVGDDSKDFEALGIQTQFDVDQGTALAAYTINIPDYGGTYTILNIDSNGRLILEYDGTLPSTSVTGKAYTIYNGLTVVATGSSGYLNVTNRARITVLNPAVLPIGNIIKTNLYYQVIGGTEYPVIGLVPGTTDQFYISEYAGLDQGGINLILRRFLTSNLIGYMSYRGLNLLVSGVDYETSLGIQNGANNITAGPVAILNNGFKENFIVKVDDDYYWMSDINGNSPAGSTTMTLSGLSQYWRTLANGGTSVTVSIYKFDILGATIMGQQGDQPPHTFETLDRSGGPVITGTDSTTDTVVASLAIKPEDNMVEDIRQKEGVSFTIQYTDGSVEQGEL